MMQDNKAFDWENVQPEENTETRDEFFNFENGPLSLLFEDSNPKEVEGTYGPVAMFKVQSLGENGCAGWFSTGSKRLLRELKAHLPLDGKILKITRAGVKFDTQYKVEQVL